MPLWLALALSLVAVVALLACMLRVRYRVDWDGRSGGSNWSARVQYGIPGFMRSLQFPEASENPPRETSAPTRGQEGFLRLPRPPRWDRNRWRRALFRLVTDGLFLEALLGFFRRGLFSIVRVLHLSVEMDLSLPDPESLGQVAGIWQAVGHFPLARRVHLRCDFEPRDFRLRLGAEGGFTAAHLLAFGAGTLWSFPWWRVARRAWFCWHNSRLSGWRAFAYGRIQAL